MILPQSQQLSVISKMFAPDAPWCPSNLEFIRRMNGLGSLEEVAEIVYNASYLVMDWEMFILVHRLRYRLIHATGW